VRRHFAYDEGRHPPAPVLPLHVGSPERDEYVLVASLVDTGADCTLVPAEIVRRAATPPTASRPGPRRLIHLRPEGVEVHGQAPAARSTHVTPTRRERYRIAAVTPQLEDLQAAKLRVDDPVIPDSGARVVTELVDAVAARVSRARRGDLHREVRRHADERVREGGTRPGR